MTAALLIVTALFLIALAVWDCRRTFRRIDEAHRQNVEPVEPVDFAGEIRVRDRTRRGPEPCPGKEKLGRRGA